MKKLYIAPTIKVRKANVPSLMAISQIEQGNNKTYRPDIGQAKSGKLSDFDIDDSWDKNQKKTSWLEL